MVKPLRSAAKSSRSTPALPRMSAPTPAPNAAPKLTKDELRAQVTKLESSIAALRAKSREANRAIKAANSRIAELETQVAELEQQATAAQARFDAAKAPKATRRPRIMRKAATDSNDEGPHDEAVESPPSEEAAQASEDVPS